MADFTFDPRIPAADNQRSRRAFVSFETTLADAERMLANGNMRYMPRLLASASRSTRALALYRYAFGYPLPYVSLYFCRSAAYKLRELALRPETGSAESEPAMRSHYEPNSMTAWPTMAAIHAALICDDMQAAVELARTVGHETDLEHHSPEAVHTAYAVRDFLLGNDEEARANIEQARSHEESIDLLSYLQALEGILDQNRPAVNKGLRRVIDLHLKEYSSKEERYSPERFLSIAGLGLLRMAWTRDIKPLTKHPLIPRDLLETPLPATLPYIDSHLGFRLDYPALWAWRKPTEQVLVLGNLFVNGGEITLEIQQPSQAGVEPSTENAFQAFVRQYTGSDQPLPAPQGDTTGFDAEGTSAQGIPIHLRFEAIERAGLRFLVFAQGIRDAWHALAPDITATLQSIRPVGED